MIVYSNSCSYGVCSTGKVYSEFIAEFLEADKLVNGGYPGSCNQRIIRTTIRDCLKLKKEHDNILALIGITHPNRFEYWGDAVQTRKDSPPQNDGDFQSFHPTTPLYSEPKKFADSWNRLYNDEAAMTNLFVELIKLTSFFKSQNIQYLIWANSDIIKSVDYRAPFIVDFAEELSTDSMVLSFANFSFVKYCISNNFVPYDYNLYGDLGHHEEEAHKSFADYLLKNYLNEV